MLAHPQLKGVQAYGVIQSTLEGRGNSLLRCFTRHYKRDSRRSMRITMRILINEPWRVVVVRVTKGTFPKQFVQCIRMVIERTRFPSPSGGSVLLENTLTYQPGSRLAAPKR